MAHRSFALAAAPWLPLVLALTSGCATREVAPSGFGPPPAAPAHATPVVQAPVRVARGYLPSRSVPMPKAVALRQTRIDALDPAIQNWEIELDVSRPGASADRDELFAVWMTGRPGAEGRTLTQVGMARSGDGARSFTRVDVQSPIAEDAVPFDPVVEFDPVTQRTFVSVMEQTPPFTRQTWVARSEPGQDAQFEPGRLVPLAQGEHPDKGWFAIGRHPEDDTRSVVYLASQAGMRVSHDGGDTWQGPTKLPASSNLLQPQVLDDGALVVAYLGSGGQALFVRSEDAGQSYSQPASIHDFVGGVPELTHPAIPGSFRVPPTTMIAKAPGGRLYAVLHDVVRREGVEADVGVLLFTSDDRGRTWSAGRDVTSDLPALSDQFLPWLAVDGQGRLHLAYFDTSRFVGVDADPDALVDVWYASSDDEGASWSRTRLTQAPIDSFGTRWSPTSNAPRAQFLGDYFTLAASTHAVYVAHPVQEAGVYGMTVSRIELAGGTNPAIRDPRGLSGLWYEPATSGQGFEFNWLAGDALAVAFYGHRDNGANLFLTGLRAGRFGYGEALDIPLNGVSGGRFNDFDRESIRITPWGRLTLRFDACDRAQARLEGADGTKEMQLVRLAVAPDLPCD